MSVSASLGHAVMRAAASNAIESSKESDLIAAAAQRQKEAQLQQDMSGKEIAAKLQEYQTGFQIAQDCVGVVQGGAKVGETTKDVVSKTEAKGKIEGGLKDARNGDLHSLKECKLGDKKVGERFTDEQIQRFVKNDAA